MASFLLFMLNTNKIKYGTAQGYVGSVCNWHMDVLGGLGNPIADVIDWKRFCNACAVQSWVDASIESHVMFPFELLVKTLLCLDRTDRMDCALGLMMLMMFFTMCRSQTPLPKSRDSFDPINHLRRGDVRMCVGRTDAMEWNLGVVKNSTSKEKAAPLKNKNNWKPTGICDGVLNIMFWFNAYSALSSWDSPDDPLFYDESGVLTYVFMLRYMRNAVASVPGMTWDLAKIFGFHGLRVLGFNCTRASTGDDVAILQGGWLSGAWQTYSRDDIDKIVDAARKGASYAAENILPSLPLDIIFTPPDTDHVPRPDRAYPAPPPPVPAPSASVEPGPSSGPGEQITGISNLVISTLDYTSDGSVGSVDGVPSSATVEERIQKKGKKYKVHTWNGNFYYSLTTLRAAYAARKVEQAEFFSTLAAFGYLHL